MENNKTRSAFFYVLLLVIAMFSVQSGASLGKSLFPLIGPQGVTALRVSFGTVILMLFLQPWKYRSQWVLNKRNIGFLIAYGLSLGLMNLTFYMSVERIPLGIAVALEFTGPLAVAMIASRKPIDFLWIALAVLGLYFLLPIDRSISNLDPVGTVYALIAGTCWALYIIFGKRAGGHFGTPVVALGAFISSLFLLPIGVVTVGSELFSWSILPIALGVALLSTALPYSLEMIALTKLPTKTFGTLMSLEPTAGAVCGFIFLGEVLSLVEWFALLAIVIASMGAALTIKPSSEVASVEH